MTVVMSRRKHGQYPENVRIRIVLSRPAAWGLDRVSIYLQPLEMGRTPDGRRQKDIADAILRVAGREGIGALTMQRLGRELGVTSGALFRHFPSGTATRSTAPW
jgi:hypothetical protein